MPLDEAVAATVRVAPTTGVERVPLAELPGRRLAAAVRARAAIPPFTHSAMDGYAVRSRDCPGALRLRGESAAGHPARHAIRPGEACRISTGARLPDGADAVVRQEDVRREGTTVHVPELAAGTDVRVAGEDVPVEAVVLPAGHVVRPHEVGVVAAAGHMWAACASPARVAILTTGDELVPPGDALGDGAVYESNTHGIRAQAEAAGAVVGAVAHVGDDPDATHAAIVRHLGGGDGPDDAHILITIGACRWGPTTTSGPRSVARASRRSCRASWRVRGSRRGWAYAADRWSWPCRVTRSPPPSASTSSAAPCSAGRRSGSCGCLSPVR